MKKIITTLCALFIVAMAFGQSSETIQPTKPETINNIQSLDTDFLKFFEGNVFINGEAKTVKDIYTLKEDQIQTIEVYKGQAARERFNISHNQGVIDIVTKH